MTEQDSSTKNLGGRPLKFKSVTKLRDQIDAYFAACDPHPEEIIEWVYHEVEEEYTDRSGRTKTRKVQDRSRPPFKRSQWVVTEQQPYTITGLSIFLGTSRQTLINYQNRDKFFDTIKAAKDRCEEFWELKLLGPHATGPIFNLKNNFDWRDKQEVDHTSKGEPIPLLAGVAPAKLEVEEEDDGGPASADDSADEDQQS